MKILIAIFIHTLVFSQSFYKLMSEKEKIEIRKDAVLKVTATYKGKLKIWATAFFISKDGYVLATNHMLEPYYAIGDNDNWVFTFQDRKGNTYSSVDMIKCSDKINKLDICLLKTSEKMKSKWIPIEETYKINIGEENINKSDGFKFYLTGNPVDKDFEDARIELIAHKKNQLGIQDCGLSASDHNNVSIMEVLPIEGKPRHGFSGAPLINGNGDLVGMWKGGRGGLYNPKTIKCDRYVHIAIPGVQLQDFFQENRLKTKSSK